MSKADSLKANSETLKYSIEQFDKAIVFIASGALGISFAFIKDIIPDLKKAIKTENLIYSWYLFGAVIFISLVAHFISILAHSWAVQNSGLANTDFNAKVKYWNLPIRILNVLMIALISIGIIQLIYFIQTNLNFHE